MKNDLQEILEELDMETWVDQEGIPFKMVRGSSGMQINVKECPDCGNRKWKVYLNAETGLGNCFVCEKHYSKFSFIQTYLSLNKRETVRVMKKALTEQGWKPRRTITAAVEYDKVKFPLSFPLPTPTGQNLLYLEARNVDVDLAEYFHLRFCEEGWWNFKSEDGKLTGQNFSNRIVIPIFDLNGDLVTFQGRDITGEAEKKYLFPSGLPGTGRFLFNGQNGTRAKRMVMGEGVFDVIAIKRALDEEADLRDIIPVGSFGKHLSHGSLDGDDQLGRFLQLKRDGLEEVTIMWDGEYKALLAALDAADKLSSIGLRVRIALLPSDKDPNEVPANIVRKAFWEAKLYTSKLAIQWRLRNPYEEQNSLISFDLKP